MPVDTEPAAAAARAILPQSVYDYYAGSAGDESTYDHNRAAFRRVRFRPHVLTPVSRITTTTTLPGLPPLSAPLLIAPMAMQQMAHRDGELAVARAARHHNLPLILSTLSNHSLEHVAETGVTCLFQLYLHRDRALTSHLLRRARNAGYKAVVLTVDAPRYGRRLRDRRNAFCMPAALSLGNLTRDTATPAISTAKHSASALDALGDSALDADLSVSALRWVVREARLPVWVKGVLRGDDARTAVNAGAAAVVVSNHGGRQLEACVAGLEALPEVVAEVGGEVPVLVDGGVRSGEDVVKAVALGASACLIGRPVLWGLAGGGEEGVKQVLGEVLEGVQLGMVLCGAREVQEISRDLVEVRREGKL